MKFRENELFCLGVVTGTHGLRGDLKVRLHSSNTDPLLSATQVLLGKEGEDVTPYGVARAAVHKGRVLLRLKGLEHINAVQSLVGCEVFMRYKDLPELPEDEFYWYELEGLTVVDRVRGELGTLQHVFTTAAHDIYVVQGRYGEVLIPAVSEFVIEIDPEAGRMSVDLPEGLVQEPDEV